ncbi:MAG: chemotaxis protein CheA, partial [Rhodocyclaceae bacterium]
MSDFAGMEDLLQDFLVEATDLLSGVDNKLVELEKNPQDVGLLNDIFRGFHTIKGGAGFLNATELVTLCHLTENLFDKLRNGEMTVSKEIMDVILSATAAVREMFAQLEGGVQPAPADARLLADLEAALSGELIKASVPTAPPAATSADSATGPDWDKLYGAVTGAVVASAAVQPAPASASPAAAQSEVTHQTPEQIIQHALGRRATDKPGVMAAPTGRRADEKARDTTIRVDTARLDQVLNLSGEIGLTKNRLNALRSEIINGRTDTDTLHALDQAVSQLDLLVSDLQNAVMKTRMQPIGRLFQKYPRIARDLARSLGKDVELVLVGEETEIDKTMIEDLSDPIIHLIRNAVDHGVESPAERRAAGKPEKSEVRLEARQEGDHIVIIVADDGKG